MQSDNGWFQLESRRPVKSTQSERKGTAQNRPAPEPDKTMQRAANDNTDSFTLRQKPYAENAQQRRYACGQEYPENPAARQADAPGSKGAKPQCGAIYNSSQCCGATQAEMGYAAENAGSAHGGPCLSWEEDRALKTLHSQTVGPRGPVLKQDARLHEALGIFASRKTLERPVHVKGYGAFGYFQTMNSMREYTALNFLQSPGQQVPVMVRFSLAAGNKGTPDTSRNARGFATKFYTQGGVFDLVFNHIPVLFVRDGMRFAQAFTSLDPSPVNNLRDPERFWKFVADAPESMHFVTWLYSDVGTLKSFSHMRGSSVNTFVWRNALGVPHYVKYHWIPLAGEEYIDSREAVWLAGINPDIAGQALYDTIASGRPVQYDLYVQIMDPQDECSLSFDPLDCTKTWDESMYPLIPVGRMTLNRNPDNFLEQVEKAAFSPANLLEGAELSDDKLLQARSNIYWTSQRRRIGEDFRSTPVNAQPDWTPDKLVTGGTEKYVEGRLVRSPLCDPDNFTQAGQRYHSLSPTGQDHLVENLAEALSPVGLRIRDVVLDYLYAASRELGQRVASQIAACPRR